jgi:hypothetical protein
VIKCRGNERSFWDQTLKDCCTWLFQPKHQGTTAHNAQGYDAQFILRYLVTHDTVKPKLIMNGSKIIMLEAHQVRLIDNNVMFDFQK